MKTIVVGTNSLTESQYPAYSNHCQMWFRYGRSYTDFNFIFVNPSRMSIDRMRNMTVKVALEQEADYVLFIDDDVLVPLDGLAKLLACNADVAGGKAVIRGYPFDWMVFSEIEQEGNDGLKPFKELPKEGIIPVGATGFCFTLIKVDVFRPMKAPYFVTGLSWTEDIYFYLKAKQANPELRAVVDCSVDCGHILWPEVMNSENREHYKRYYEEMNPELKQSLRGIHEPLLKAVDHEVGYLDQIEKAVADA